ncbi:MAG: hypothetical protein DVB23_002596 [Verrucomicrobia bacterium]|jgi:hypothetical protein|nr:MAG: hypothetical protein DVB23_002596 [Verrucomicrobiota bacterium]
MFPVRKPLFIAGGLVAILTIVWLLVLDLPTPFGKAGNVVQRPGEKQPSSPSVSMLGKVGSSNPAASGWTPPQGDPVARFRELKGAPAQVRKDLISNFMALGHDRNPYLLIEALTDADADVRLFAVESAASLTVGEATAVLAASSSNPDPSVREMTWSLAAPYPVESKATIFSGALRQGDETILNEAFTEMRIRPEKALFEMMLTEAIRPGVEVSRHGLLLGELKAWLVPGGGDVPEFANASQMAEWWRASLVNYDDYLLRTDVNP